MTAKQQPEALAQLAKEARRQPESGGGQGANMTADVETKPIPTDNELKHSVAEKLLAEGGGTKEPPKQEVVGATGLPDRTRSTN